MIPLLRPGTVHHLYCPGCLAFSSSLDYLWIPPAQELELMKQTSNGTFHLVMIITSSSAHLWYHFLVDTSTSDIHDICSRFVISFPDNL